MKYRVLRTDKASVYVMTHFQPGEKGALSLLRNRYKRVRTESQALKEGQIKSRGHQENMPLKQVISMKEKTGRNEPCICGSGNKYKKCCDR